MQRRTFLAVGAAGAAALAAAGWWSWLRKPGPVAARALDDDAAMIVTALVPAILAGALPDAAPERAAAIRETVAGVDRAIAGLPPHARAEIGQLFALLALAPGRRAFAGVASPWPEAGVDEVTAFLDRWRASGWALKRTAYDALIKLVTAAWYGNPRSWPSIGYDGPPKLQGNAG
jgi:hypothetical protein